MEIRRFCEIPIGHLVQFYERRNFYIKCKANGEGHNLWNLADVTDTSKLNNVNSFYIATCADPEFATRDFGPLKNYSKEP
jgi:hypothetical protein